MKALGSSAVLWCLLLVSPALGFECTFTPQEQDLAKLSAMLTDVEIGQWAVGALKRYHGLLTEGELVERVHAVADESREMLGVTSKLG